MVFMKTLIVALITLMILSACGSKGLPVVTEPVTDTTESDIGQTGTCRMANAFGEPIDLVYTMTNEGYTVASTCRVLDHDTQEQLAIGQGDDNCFVDYGNAQLHTTAGTTATVKWTEYPSEHNGQSQEYDSCARD